MKSNFSPIGFHSSVRNIKAPIPAQWAKDHLRALNEDSVTKAFKQLDKIAGFFASEKAASFLARRLPRSKPAHLHDGFLVACKFVIITSDNAGMFSADQDHVIIDYQTLRRALEKCDGDIAYLLKIFTELPSWLDQGRKIST